MEPIHNQGPVGVNVATGLDYEKRPDLAKIYGDIATQGGFPTAGDTSDADNRV